MFKKLKPATPSLRHSFLTIKKLSKKPILKNKIRSIKRSLGKNNTGKIVVRRREVGAKKKYRELNLKRQESLKGVVCSLEHDPFRSAFIMSVFNAKKKHFFYTLAPAGILVGDSVETGRKVTKKAGNSGPLRTFPAGSLVSNITINPQSGGQIARSAGSYGILLGQVEDFCFLELMSGETRLVPSKHYAQLGKISNETHFLEQSGKAGRSRWLGKRPHVRGVAMNPIDHPNGGGEGKKSGLGKNPWGQLKKGQGVKNHNPLIIKRRNG